MNYKKEKEEMILRHKEEENFFEKIFSRKEHELTEKYIINLQKLTAESSGSVLVIGYDSWVTRLRVSGGFSIPAFMRMQLMDMENE